MTSPLGGTQDRDWMRAPPSKSVSVFVLERRATLFFYNVISHYIFLCAVVHSLLLVLQDSMFLYIAKILSRLCIRYVLYSVYICICKFFKVCIS